ncbi:MAG: transposase, partial [Gammaproteobacteria bacterium]|nr:transposase [Gammaproteobacteria bacterium]
MVRAPRGDKIVSGGKFGCNLVATLLVDKYRDGLPLHRQKRRFAQMGLPVAVSTLADQVTWATDLLRPLWRAASVVVLASSVMQLDGTGLAVRDTNHPRKKKMGSLWGYIGDETALYLYMPTGKKCGQRPGELGPEDMLSLRDGFAVADGSNLFDASFKR